MGMAVGPAEGEDEAISAINTTPLVDVMLVLLIIFLITIPVVTQSIAMQLPQEKNVPRQTAPENIEISVNKEGDVYWGMQKVRDNDDLFNRLKEIDISFGIEPEAVRIMLNVHQKGVGVAGTYSYEVAESKAEKAMKLAREHEFPLRTTVEPA